MEIPNNENKTEVWLSEKFGLKLVLEERFVSYIDEDDKEDNAGNLKLIKTDKERTVWGVPIKLKDVGHISEKEDILVKIASASKPFFSSRYLPFLSGTVLEAVQALDRDRNVVFKVYRKAISEYFEELEKKAKEKEGANERNGNQSVY